MNSATFKTLCEAVGLDCETIADVLDVNVRSVQRWWSKQDPVPAAIEYLESIIDVYDRFLEGEMAALDGQPDETTAVLTVYRNQASFDVATGGKAPMPWKVYESAIQQLALYAALDEKAFVVEYVHSEM